MSDVVTYAKILDAIGTRVVEISNGMKINVQTQTIENLKIHQEMLKNSYVAFVECRDMLSLVKPPYQVTEEHKQLIDAYEDFLRGTKEMINSFNLQTMSFDKAMYQAGYAKQTIGETRTVEVVNRIVDKLNS